MEGKQQRAGLNRPGAASKGDNVQIRLLELKMLRRWHVVSIAHHFRGKRFAQPSPKVVDQHDGFIEQIHL